MISKSAPQNTEVVYRPAPGKPYSESTITVNRQRVQVVDKFTYLGSTLSRTVQVDDEVVARIAKASVAFGRLRGNVWGRSGNANPLICMGDMDSVPMPCQKT